MKPAEAQALLAELRSAYPNASVDADTNRLYQRELKPLRFELATEAVRSALHACKFLPTIAELHYYYAIAREQHRRDVEAENRRLERLAEDNLPRLPLKDIPGVQEHRAKLATGDATAALNLESVSDGKCDDCPAHGPRFAFFALALCSKCVANRLRVKAQMEAA